MQRLITNVAQIRPKVLSNKDSVTVGDHINKRVVGEVLETEKITSAFTVSNLTVVEVLRDLQSSKSEEYIRSTTDRIQEVVFSEGLEFPAHFNADGIFLDPKDISKNVRGVFTGTIPLCMKYIKENGYSKYCLAIKNSVYALYEVDYINIWIYSLDIKTVVRCFELSDRKVNETFFYHAIVKTNAYLEPIFSGIEKLYYVSSSLRDYCEEISKYANSK